MNPAQIGDQGFWNSLLLLQQDNDIFKLVSLVFLKDLVGVREGTVFSALTVGLLLRWISSLHKRFKGPEPEASASS